MRELYDVNIFLCYAYETATSKTLFTLRNSLNKQCQNPSFEKKTIYICRKEIHKNGNVNRRQKLYKIYIRVFHIKLDFNYLYKIRY